MTPGLHYCGTVQYGKFGKCVDLDTYATVVQVLVHMRKQSLGTFPNVFDDLHSITNEVHSIHYSVVHFGLWLAVRRRMSVVRAGDLRRRCPALSNLSSLITEQNACNNRAPA